MEVKKDEVLRFLKAINSWECNKYFEYTNELVDFWNRAMIVKKEKATEGFTFHGLEDSISIPTYLYYTRDFDKICKILKMEPSIIVMKCKTIVIGITDLFYLNKYNEFVGMLRQGIDNFISFEELADIICEYPEEFEDILRDHLLIME